jgi:hypothetical protein
MISKCKVTTIQYFLAFVNAREIFLITRINTTGIENKKASIPKPGTQGPLGDIFSSNTIAVIVMV